MPRPAPLSKLLLAGLAMAAAHLAPGAPSSNFTASYDRSTDSHEFTVYLRDGGWCWFQDPRALISENHLLVGGVQGNGSGPVVVGIHDLESGAHVDRVVLRDDFDADDHNTPAFYRRSDGQVLAIYARHSRDFKHHYRFASAGDPAQWSSERIYEHDYPNAGKVTYMNLWFDSSSGLLYNFFRGIEFNPSFITSRDEGLTWENPTHFIDSELEGWHRPYPRYAGDSHGKLHVSFTDGHPRQFGNSIYYAAFHDGTFHQANGTPLKHLSTDGPLRPSEAELVYQGSGNEGRGNYASAIGAAWTSETAVDANGHPHIAFTVYHANDDNRFHLASWDGSRWNVREVAYAGRCLYDREASYTGLMALDPMDPSIVFISTDVDPSTGKSSKGRHEIYRARISAEDDISSIEWEPVTQDSPVRNIRPFILRDGNRRVVLWNRGDFVSYLDYQLDTVGFSEPVTTP